MKIFSVWSKECDYVFLEDKFSWSATFFTGFWAIYNKAYTLAIITFALNLIVGFFATGQANIYLSNTIFIALFYGFFSYDILSVNLAKKSYVMLDIITAKTEEEAKYKFFERVVQGKKDV